MSVILMNYKDHAQVHWYTYAYISFLLHLHISNFRSSIPLHIMFVNVKIYT